ncbi:putative fatty acyl-CoA reductase CG5065 [Culex pipiens pallens]|uniref:putative fatty acyl-CoA reductase CG5065 n=1 Tax=Culex pipiens pallens TaxID=42434 RepID=UPI0019541749|nr:putative fatty acyl-CoA reductase CG5065 [Culex pipiens pallens]
MSNCSESKFLELYRGSTVLLAGGTGFLGKTLLEKILRCLPVRKIYLLIRTKRGCCGEERLKTILEDRLFDRVRKPELIAKIVPVEVDYAEKDFGLASELTCEIRKEVEIVLYCIATVKMTGALKETVETNVFLARRMLRWCRTFPRLEAFVYTSTFYCNFDKEICEEKVYKELPFGSYDIVMNMMKYLSAEECEQLKSTILQKFPNTYTFSKRLAEIMIETEFGQTLPIAIYRPPVITPTCREPMLGWTDNSYGPVAFVKSFWDGLGLVKYENARVKCDLAPIDYCANAVLICAFDVAEKRRVSSDACVPVYNHHSNMVKTTFGDMTSCIGDSRKGFWERIIWKYCWFSTPFLWMMYLNVILAKIKDCLAQWLPGSNPAHKFYYQWSAMWFMRYSQSVGFVTFRNWKSVSSNLKQAQRNLSEHEQQIFFTDLDEINWREYLSGYVDGAIQYLESVNKKRLKS